MIIKKEGHQLRDGVEVYIPKYILSRNCISEEAEGKAETVV